MDCSFRAVAQKMLAALDGVRNELLDNQVWPRGYGFNQLMPQGMIGETYANLDTPRDSHFLTYPGLLGALEAAEAVEEAAEETEEDEEDEDE